jgi:hypothetical protein
MPRPASHVAAPARQWPAAWRAAGIAASLAAGTAAAQGLPACPERVAVTESLQGEAPPDWSAIRRASDHQLFDIRFHAGNPAEAPAIEPVAGNTAGGVISLRYSLPAAGGEIWMACIYADTAFTLVRRLEGPFPPHVRVNHDRRDRRVFLTYF